MCKVSFVNQYIYINTNHLQRRPPIGQNAMTSFPANKKLNYIRNDA